MRCCMTERRNGDAQVIAYRRLMTDAVGDESEGDGEEGKGE